VILAIAGRRSATMRILADAVLADVAHTYTDDPGTADVVVVLDASARIDEPGPHSVVVAYADDAAVVRALAHAGPRVVTFGLSPSADVRAEAVEATAAGTRFEVVAAESRAVASVGILGESIVPLALAALAVSGAAGVPTVDAIAGLATVTSAAEHDMQVSRLSAATVLVDDTADGTPLSTADALKALAQLTVDGTRSIAVLGELDLDSSSDPLDHREQHDRIGRLVVRLNVSRLIVVGQSARHIHNAAGLEGSWDGESVLVESADEAYDLLNDSEFADTAAPVSRVVLVKSSPTSGLSALADRISHTTAFEGRKATA